MTDRASFLARVASTPRGADPGLPARDAAPDAPTQLRAGEDALDRFQREAEAVSTLVRRVAAAEIPRAVGEELQAEGVRAVAVAGDLADGAAVIDALLADGFEAAAYADVAPDRERAAGLEATVTGCTAAIAATGTVVTAAGGAGRAGALIAPVHVCVVRRSDLVDGLHELFDGDRLAGAGSLIAFQSGPSRSADIEKTLILGVHGPGRVHVLLVDDA